MANRCQSCDKLCGLETEEPEVELEVDGDLVRGTARLVRVSACCGEEVKETEFEFEEQIPLGKVKDHPDNEENDHELEVVEGDVEATERFEGRGRGVRTFFGVRVSYVVRCSCQGEKDPPLDEGEFTSEVQASHMDEVN